MEGLIALIWVRFPFLSRLLWDGRNISRIAAMLGEQVGMDTQTSWWGQSTFARVCVRMDLSQKLPTDVWINGEDGEFFQPVEYEGISVLCFACGKVGHKIDHCNHRVWEMMVGATNAVDTPLASNPICESVNNRSHCREGDAPAVSVDASVGRNPLLDMGKDQTEAGSTSKLTAANTSARQEYDNWILVEMRKPNKGKQGRGMLLQRMRR